MDRVLRVPGVFLYLLRAARGDTSAQTRARLCAVADADARRRRLAPFRVVRDLHCRVDDRRSFRWTFGARCWRVDRRTCRLSRGAGHDGVRLEPQLFLSSYQSIEILVAALVGYARNGINDLFWFEYDAFVGWVGFAIVSAGLTAPINRSWRSAASSFWVPSVTLMILSIFDIYKWTLFRLPGFVVGARGHAAGDCRRARIRLIGSTQLDRWVRRESHRSWRIAADRSGDPRCCSCSSSSARICCGRRGSGLGAGAVNVLNTSRSKRHTRSAWRPASESAWPASPSPLRQWRVG
jgi:hypothetical protein